MATEIEAIARDFVEVGQSWLAFTVNATIAAEAADLICVWAEELPEHQPKRG